MDKKVYEHIYNETGEKIVEWKKCSCGQDFAITDRDLEFYEKISPAFNGQKYLIPTPTLCPDCRQQRRLVWRNERKLYKRKCDLTGKDMISMYSSDKLYKVYEQSEWWSDKWDSLEYGQDFDFSKGFFEQFDDLKFAVPKPSLYMYSSENSPYCNYSNDLKDCYLCVGLGKSENVYYTYVSRELENCIDCAISAFDKESYELIDCFHNFNCSFSQSCNQCSDISYCYNCTNCKNCYFCANLNNKQYCILNKQYTMEKYETEIINIKQNLKTYLEQFLKLSLNYPRQNQYLNSSENCFGHIMLNSNNSSFCYDVMNLDSCKFIINCGKGENSYDVYGLAYGSSLAYEGINILLTHSAFCVSTLTNTNIYYCNDCYNSSNLFGCIGLRNKEYCILNKQYTKEEYEQLVPKIIEHMKKTGEWGEFFPSSISPFGYNESLANEYYPLSKQEALTKGFNWSDYEVPFPKTDKTIPASKLPENIRDIPDDILNWAIECEVSKKPFRIIKQELEFYRKHNLPVPRRHPDVRHMDRMNKRAKRQLFLKNCDKCGIEMISVYNKDIEYKVYCEECYKKEVV